ncbi:membrane protein [Candidatus Scalindua japonica]|uniref:Membrane protein n=1 Tax=Candidatus Scalindua japonica TaxID=1284222 RepID=A0A286U178_9BACT|nr:glycosyltransferase family 39 protein [Candidatus Scalindua japonica]GAX61888.1 membrane protein [Candidatus Scalindua japonica]
MKTMTLESDRKVSFFNDKYLWTLLAISLSVRIYLSFFTCVIKNDSVAFMQIAKYFANGDFLNGLRHDYHPLYSLFIAAVHKVIPNMESSGTIVSVFFGTLTVIIFYFIGKSVFDHKISFVSAIILAFHPYAVRFSADIISESTYFFFFISALGSGYFAISKKKLHLFALSGICSAFAYLTRPEGIGIIIIVAGWCCIKDINCVRSIWKDKLASISILAVSFLVFSSPYLIYIKNETGMWLLTKKRNLSQKNIVTITENPNGDVLINKNTGNSTSGVDTKKKQTAVNKMNTNKISKDVEYKKPGTEKKTLANVKLVKKPSKRLSLKTYLESLSYVLTKYISTFHPFLFIFFIIGVINWSRIKKAQFFGLYLASVIAFYLVVLYRLNIVNIAVYNNIYQYPSRRHLMPIVIPAIICVGIGVYATGIWVQKKYQSNSMIAGFKELLKSVWIMQLIVLMIVISVLLPKTLKPQRFDKLGIKNAGQWVKGNSHKPSPLIVSTSVRNAYYAGGGHIQIGNINNTLSLAKEKKVDYILLTQREYNAIETELKQSIKNNKIELAYKYPEEKHLNRHSIFLYKVLY